VLRPRKNFANGVVVNSESCLAALPESGNAVMHFRRKTDAYLRAGAAFLQHLIHTL
jgi:hypothetical protein